MTTLRQIEANRRNSKLSTGPKTPAGLASASRNSFDHGMSGEGIVRTEEETRLGAERVKAWRALYRPSNAKDEWLIEQTAFLSIRLSRCWTHDWALRMLASQRAEGCWEEDRRLAAVELGAKLSARPEQTVSRLKKTRQGCTWLLDRWEPLAAVLRDGGDWTETHRALAHDLLGTPAQVRDLPNRIDPAKVEGESLRAARLAVAEAEIDALRQLHDEVMVGLDESERLSVVMGYSPEIDRPAQLARRYETTTARRMQWALAQLDKLKTGQQSPADLPAPPPLPATPVKLTSALPAEPEPADPRLCIAVEPMSLFDAPEAVTETVVEMKMETATESAPEPDLEPEPAPSVARPDEITPTAPAARTQPQPEPQPRGNLATSVLGLARSASTGNRRDRRAQKRRDRRR